ncbi:MAG TPA: type IX secretion system plug protein domain-containing protein [Bacteroidota bacterium]|nr:type IX secretion system plug protein domain-containing protein [Bacteroidota bacterium]
MYSSKLKGLRIYGQVKSHLPVARPDGQPISIEFDIEDAEPKDFRLRFYHCDKDWKVTENSFVNDELRNTTKFPVPFAPAPQFVQRYTFHYNVKVPGFSGLDRFPQSGNYIFQIWDKEEKELHAAGRFFVVEDLVTPTMRVGNRYLPSVVSPWNQVNVIDVSFKIPDQTTNQTDEFYPILLNTVDVYRNRQLYSALRIGVNDNSPNTFVDGFGLQRVKFVIDNVMPGNEYRQLDLRNIDHYPPGKDARPRRGADVSRFLHQGAKDQDGTSTLTTGNRYSDYIKFDFELLWDAEDLDSVYVAGDFNGWNPNESWRMTYDSETKRYRLSSWMRRGAYDFQYVAGKNNWISLEGNNLATVNLYTAFVYYHDPRFGGFDRILGYVQGFGPGGAEASRN